MINLYYYLLPAMWLCWAIYWWAVSRDVKTTARRESISSQLSHIVPVMIAVILVSPTRFPVPVLGWRFLPFSPWQFWVGAALTLSGLLFTVWARVHIGKNWSGTVTVKQDHEMITSGPYSIVRHPIYTGLLLGFIGSALARGELRGIVAVALVFWALYRKLRIEESWMRDQFGDAYREYSRRVSALIPFVL